MKAPFAILLAACLCMDGVFSLVCWSCDNVDANWKCWTIETCSDEDKYCITVYSSAGIGGSSTQSISKGCALICPENSVNIGIAVTSVECCTSSLCNVGGANSI